MPCPRHSSNRVRRLLAAAALVACAARAALVCDAPEHDFGTLPDTDLGVSHTFEVRNTGSDPVVRGTRSLPASRCDYFFTGKALS